MKKILLNDILNLSETELAKTKIRFQQNNGETHPIDEYIKDHDIINNRWFLWRSKKRRYFNVGDIAICLVQLSLDTWLLTTIKSIETEHNITNGINYSGSEIEKYSSLFGRLVVKYHKNSQSQTRLALKDNFIESLEVLKILSSTYDGEDFSGYDNIRLSYFQLQNIIKKYKETWIAALENQKAVYLITDTATGLQYVGSAYGENGMLLARWSNYIKNGHGGNKLLKEVVDKNGFEYVQKNFQYSILENYNARTDKKIILTRESWWKEVLGSRAFGLNAN